MYRGLCLTRGHKDFSMFSSGRIILLSLWFKLIFMCIIVWVWIKIVWGGKFSCSLFLEYVYPIFLVPLVKKTILCVDLFLNPETYWNYQYSNSLYWSISLYFYANTTLPWWLYSKSWNQIVWTLKFCSFSKSFGILNSFAF